MQITLGQEPRKIQESNCDFTCLVGQIDCPETKGCKIKTKLTEHIRRRYYSHKKRALNEFFIDPPLERDIATLFQESLVSGFNCKYCETPLNMWATKDQREHSISLDHIIPLISGGTNKKENLQLICHRCNIVKNKTHPDYYGTVIDALKTKYGIGGVNKYLDVLYPILFANDIRKWNKEGEQ